jgi:hypothetical protein
MEITAMTTTMTVGEIVDAITPCTWSAFAMSILNQILEGRRLSEKQEAAIVNFITKVRNRDAEKTDTNVKIHNLIQIFREARQKGVKKGTLRVHQYIIREAPITGRNPESLYVIDRGREELVAIIRPDGTLDMRKGGIEDRQNIIEIDANPHQYIIKFGILTGHCSICGRILTDENSISKGIGPICAAKWGVV